MLKPCLQRKYMKYTDLQIIKFEIGDTATFWKKSSSILYSLYYFFFIVQRKSPVKRFSCKVTTVGSTETVTVTISCLLFIISIIWSSLFAICLCELKKARVKHTKVVTLNHNFRTSKWSSFCSFLLTNCRVAEFSYWWIAVLFCYQVS